LRLGSGPRDILFVVDASQSMDSNIFFGPHTNPTWPASGPQFIPSMLDIVEELFCRLYNNATDHKVGLLIFSHTVKVFIPLAAYTPADFINRVEVIRQTKNSPAPVCCSCCTPLAEAFDLAGTEIARNGAANTRNGLQLVYVLTDGKPYQNSYGPYAWPKIDEATYLYSIVPQRSRALKAKGINVLLVAVPSRDDNPGGVAPKINYFNGIVDPALRPNGDPRIVSSCKNGDLHCQCAYPPIERKPTKIFCSPMTTPPFPIQSQGLFFNSTWENIVNDTANSASCGTIIADQTDSPTTAAPSTNPIVSSAAVVAFAAEWLVH
jgi:hypothetical protein